MARESSGPSKRKLRGDDRAGLWARRLASEVRQAFEKPTAPAGEEVPELPMPAQDPELPAEVSRVDADLQATPSPVADVGQFVPSTELEEPPKSTSLAEPIPDA
jgi:hypothetical protein